MVTRVLDAEGNTLHDCAAAGCEVSWDGYVIADGTAAEGRTDPDPNVWSIDGDTATAKQ